MFNYDPAAHRCPVRDIITAWAVAMAVIAMLLLLPNFAQNKIADSAVLDAGTAVDPTPMRNQEVVAESR